MKKTLAAVLAAMMALSTATVAFAADTHEDSVDLNGIKGNATVDDPDEAQFATNVDLYPEVVLDADTALGNGELYTLLEEGWIKSAVTIIDGRSAFSTIPTITATDGYARLRYKIAHTYGTSDVDIGFRVKFTATKDIYWDAEEGLNIDETGELIWEKGDTYVSADYSAAADYEEFDYYANEMTLTEEEVDDEYCLLDASDLYDVIDTDEPVVFYFEDTAAWSGKISSSQKDLNLYFTLDENEDIIDAYNDVDFEFITFKGNPAFLRSGELTFNAIGEEDTVVYELVDDELVELETEYDSTYETVTVSGVKKLTAYVIASEALEVEAEVEAETEVEAEAEVESNPNTGAC